MPAAAPSIPCQQIESDSALLIAADQGLRLFLIAKNEALEVLVGEGGQRAIDLRQLRVN